MSKESEVEKLRKDVLVTWAKGGSHAHNIVRSQLQRLSKLDENVANQTYETLQKRGY